MDLSNMDLTNISTIDFEPEQKLRLTNLLMEIASEEAIQVKLIEEIAKEKAEALIYEKMYNDLAAMINLQNSRKQDADEMNKAAVKRIEKEAEELKSSIISKQLELEQLKMDRKIEIESLKTKLAELETIETSSDLEDSTLNAESFVLLEENIKLNEQLNQIDCALKEQDIEKKNISCMELELQTKKEYLLFLKQSLNEAKEQYQAKVDEKVSLEFALNQLNNPQSEKKENGCSLFNEVDQKASKIANQYRQLKTKYIKAKEVLVQTENEILKLKTKSQRVNQTLIKFTSERNKILEDREYYKKKRVEDLENTIKLVESNIENLSKHERILINNSYSQKDLDKINKFVEDSKKIAEKLQKEIDDILINQFPLSRKVNSVDAELTIAKKQLQLLIQENSGMEKEIKLLEAKQNEALTSEIVSEQAEGVRKIRFAEDVKYLEDS